MIITIFFALASISLIIFVPIYLKKKNNLYKYKPQEKMSLKKQKKTIKNIWELGDFANSIFWVSNKYVMIIELGSIEYKLMNDEEQDNIDNKQDYYWVVRNSVKQIENQEGNVSV